MFVEKDKNENLIKNSLLRNNVENAFEFSIVCIILLIKNQFVGLIRFFWELKPHSPLSSHGVGPDLMKQYLSLI